MTPARELSARLRQLAGYADSEKRLTDKAAMVEAADMIERQEAIIVVAEGGALTDDQLVALRR